MPPRYRIADFLPQACAFLDLDPGRVLRRAGLPPDWLAQPRTDLDGATLYRLWQAVDEEHGRPDTAFRLAQAYAHGPFVPPILAFSCAETVHQGLDRLAVFKPLVAPCRMLVTRGAGSAAVELVTTVDGLDPPPGLEQFDLIYFTECIRTFTGRPVVPMAVETRHDPPNGTDHAAFFGVAPQRTGRTRLVLSAADADLPLISRSPMLWETLEPGLTRLLKAAEQENTTTERVRRTLTEALPGGVATAVETARRLNLSKRSLQRRLAEEGTSFQEVLAQVRAELSNRYLRQSDLSLPEISHLLGFRDTSSFFRAFHGWTGTTPGAWRAEGRGRLH